jgi:hypothetical protein
MPVRSSSTAIASFAAAPDTAAASAQGSQNDFNRIHLGGCFIALTLPETHDETGAIARRTR